MYRFRRLAARFAILLCAALAPLEAQPWTRMVHGVVTDQHSHPLEHAVVQLKNDWTLMVLSYITGPDGKYHFAGLNRDNYYELTADYDGVRSSTRTLSKFNSNKNPDMNLVVHLGK